MRAALIIACTVAIGCQGSGGAVSVRWRIVDLSSGDAYDPGDVKGSDGSCCCNQPGCVTLAGCMPDWRIRTVSIELADATTGAPVSTDLSPFACSLREKTTAFVLPAGTFAVSISADNVNADLGAAPVALPPASVRTIIKGDVVNLDVIEIGVDPLPRGGTAVRF